MPHRSQNANETRIIKLQAPNETRTVFFSLPKREKKHIRTQQQRVELWHCERASTLIIVRLFLSFNWKISHTWFFTLFFSYTCNRWKIVHHFHTRWQKLKRNNTGKLSKRSTFATKTHTELTQSTECIRTMSGSRSLFYFFPFKLCTLSQKNGSICAYNRVYIHSATAYIWLNIDSLFSVYNIAKKLLVQNVIIVVIKIVVVYWEPGHKWKRERKHHLVYCAREQ